MVGAIAGSAIKIMPPELSAATMKFAVAGSFSVNVSVAVPFVTVNANPDTVVVLVP